MKVEVDFYTKPIDEISREEIGLALELARTTINRCSVALREQGWPVGSYEPGSVSEKLSQAFTDVHDAANTIQLWSEDQRIQPEEA